MGPSRLGVVVGVAIETKRGGLVNQMAVPLSIWMGPIFEYPVLHLAF